MFFQHFLVTEIFAFLLVFCRIGAGVMLMPGIGEVYVPPRSRLVLALGLALVLMPTLSGQMPPVPTHPVALLLLVVGEIVIGLFLGSITRMLISAVHTAGSIIATQSGLASAMMLDITQTSQTTSLTNLMSITAVTLMFASNLHHLLLQGLADSYQLFAPGAMPPLEDMVTFSSQTLGRAFGVAIQIASPHIVIGTVIYLAAGVLARLMPQMQIFFLMMVPQLLLNFFLLMITLSGIMLWYMNYLEDSLSSFVRVN